MMIGRELGTITQNQKTRTRKTEGNCCFARSTFRHPFSQELLPHLLLLITGGAVRHRLALHLLLHGRSLHGLALDGHALHRLHQLATNGLRRLTVGDQGEGHVKDHVVLASDVERLLASLGLTRE